MTCSANEYHLTNSALVKRYPGNPVLHSGAIPYPSLLVFNAGVTKFNGRYVMVFRNDYGEAGSKRIQGTNLGLAFSDDGKKWQVDPRPCLEISDEDILWINDPRLTVLDSRCYITFAVIARSGVRGGMAVTDDFAHFEMIHTTLPDNRNLVLFPEKIGDRFIRLDRPFAGYLRTEQNRFDIWLSESPDLHYWGNHRLLLKASEIPFCNDKIGPGSPPVKTPQGWLHIFHAVDVDSRRGKNGWEDKWDKRYTAGVVLMDLENPARIIGYSKRPVLTPQESYEIAGGFRNNVIFPGGAVLEETGELKIYYGAADAVECLAVADVNELIRLCLEGKDND